MRGNPVIVSVQGLGLVPVLQSAAEVGLPGVTFLLLFYGLTIKRLWPLARGRSPGADVPTSMFAAGIIVSLVGYAVSAQFVSLIGLESPFYVAMVGAVLLAFAPAEVQDAALSEVVGGAGIRKALEPVESEAIATDIGETFLGVTTIAVPILRPDGIVAAVCVAAPTERAGRRWQARTRGALRRAAADIQAALEGQTTD